MKILYFIFPAFIVSCSNNAPETNIILHAQREAPVGWVNFTAFADSTFDYSLDARDHHKGTFRLHSDTLLLNFADSSVSVEKVFIHGASLEFIGKKTPGFASIDLNKISKTN